LLLIPVEGSEHHSRRKILAGRDDERKTAGFFMLHKKEQFIIIITELRFTLVIRRFFSAKSLLLRDAQLQAVKVFAHLTAFFYNTSLFADVLLFYRYE